MLISVLRECYKNNVERYDRLSREIDRMPHKEGSFALGCLPFWFIAILSFCIYARKIPVILIGVFAASAAYLAVFCLYHAFCRRKIWKEELSLKRECEFYNDGRLQVYLGRYVCTDSWTAGTVIRMQRRNDFPEVLKFNDWEDQENIFLKDMHINGFNLAVDGYDPDTDRDFHMELPITFPQYALLSQDLGPGAYLIIDQKTGRFAVNGAWSS